MEKKTFTIFTRHPERFTKQIQTIQERLTSLGYLRDDVHPELVIVFGGDGSLLRATKELNQEGYFLLLNSGHLGYYSDYQIEDYETMLDDIEKGYYEVERHPIYTVKINGKIIRFINDFALQTTRSVELEITINHQPFTLVRSSGIVVSSALGSTGFALSLGSPIMTSSLPCYQYTVIAPVCNKLYPNPINKALISQKDVLQIKIKRGEYTICLDGILYDHRSSPNYYQIQFDRTNSLKLIHFRSMNQIERIRKSIQVR